MSTYTTTGAMCTHNYMWGQSGKEDINNDNIAEVTRLMNRGATAWTNWKRPLWSFDLTGYAGSSADISAVTLDLSVKTAAKVGVNDRGIYVQQADPQCSRAAPASNQAQDYDPAECDWHEMFAGIGGDWVSSFGGDALQPPDNKYAIVAPTGTGNWHHSHANLAAMTKLAIDDWESWLLIYMYFSTESPLVPPFPSGEDRTYYEEDFIFEDKDHATLFPKITITYGTGGGTPMHYYRRMRAG